MNDFNKKNPLSFIWQGVLFVFWGVYFFDYVVFAASKAAKAKAATFIMRS